MHPWGLRHHALFANSLHEAAVAGADFAAAACMYAIATAYAVRFRRTRPERTGSVWRPLDTYLVRGALLSGVALALFWSVALYRMEESALELLWMPVAVPGYVLVTMHVEATIEGVSDEVNALRGLMYKHAAA